MAATTGSSDRLVRAESGEGMVVAIHNFSVLDGGRGEWQCGLGKSRGGRG